MTPVLHSLPDMRLETIGLLYVSPNITRLLAMFAGLFFSKDNAQEMAHLAVYKRYIAAFRRASSIPTDWSFFAKMPPQEYLMCALCLLFENEAFYAQAHSDSEWLALLRRAYIYMNDSGSALDMLQDTPTLEDYLNGCAGSKNFAALCAAPAASFAKLLQAVRENIPAAEHAWDAVRADVRPFMEAYWKPAYFLPNSLFAQNSAICEIYPVLVTFTTAWIIDGRGYCGVYNVSTEMQEETPADTAVMQDFTKALSDARRMEIFLLICEKPRYNRELAERLGLSPATVMHHTDALIQSGLIVLAPGETGQKRVYFQVCREKLAAVQKAFSNIFGKYV